MFVCLKQAPPNLQCLYLDTVHVSIPYESAVKRSKSRESVMLRQLMSKFTCVPSALSERPFFLRQPFLRDVVLALEPDDALLCHPILGMGRQVRISHPCAQWVIAECTPEAPFKNWADFIFTLACFCIVFRGKLGKTGRLQMTPSPLLHNVAQPVSCAWLFNNDYHRAHTTDQRARRRQNEK